VEWQGQKLIPSGHGIELYVWWVWLFMSMKLALMLVLGDGSGSGVGFVEANFV